MLLHFAAILITFCVNITVCGVTVDDKLSRHVGDGVDQTIWGRLKSPNKRILRLLSLLDPGPANATTEDVYKVCIRKLDVHFRADDNVPKRFVTWRHCQKNPPTSSWSA